MATNQDTVLVCCNLPSGLKCIVDPDNRISFKLQGTGRFLIPSPKNPFRPTPDEHRAFASAMTSVRKDLWEAWLKKVGPNFEPLKSGAVFTAGNAERASAVAAAREHETVKTGFEQVDPRDKKLGITPLNKKDTPED